MTEIRAGWDGAGFYIEAAGHSGYDIAGRDIVCAGVSALMLGTVNMTEKMERAGYIGKKTLVIRDGYVRLAARAARGKSGLLGAVFETALSGLELIEAQYPENVRITRGGMVKK